MFPVAISAVSSVVTAATATIFLLIVKNLNLTPPPPPPTQSSTLNYSSEESELSQQIITELAENEVDYELLEATLKEANETGSEASNSVSQASFDHRDDIYIADSEMLELKESSGFVVEKPVVHEFISSDEPMADLTIEARHALTGHGQHRKYKILLRMKPRVRGENEATLIPWSSCKLNAEWPLPRNVLVDVWALRRLTPFTMRQSSANGLNPSSVSAGLPQWAVKPRHPDLEVGSYDERARPFILTAQVPFKNIKEASGQIEFGKFYDSEAPWNLELTIPDLFVRYQAAQPGELLQVHANKIFYLPPPNLKFECADSSDLNVEWQIDLVRPLKVSLPIGSASNLVPHVTMASVLVSSLTLLACLFKF